MKCTYSSYLNVILFFFFRNYLVCDTSTKIVPLLHRSLNRDDVCSCLDFTAAEVVPPENQSRRRHIEQKVKQKPDLYTYRIINLFEISL